VVPIGLMNARKEKKEELEPCAKCLCYTHSLLQDNEDEILSATFQYFLTAVPVPCIPIEEFSNIALMQTINSNPHLFQVNCRINVDCLVQLLQHHPN
jgi:hypothetical protein